MLAYFNSATELWADALNVRKSPTIEVEVNEIKTAIQLKNM